MMDFSEDKFFDGRFILRQPKGGLRAGQDALLLAAMLPATFAGCLLDFGAGTGVVGHAIASRCPNASVTGIEIDESLCQQASENAKRNHFEDRLRFVCDDVTRLRGAEWRGFDAVLMNPPYLDSANHRASPDHDRERAMLGDRASIEAWLESARSCLKPKGQLVILQRPDFLAISLATLERGMGALKVLPLCSREGEAAGRVIISAIKGRKSPLCLLPAIVTDPAGPHKEWMKACLREGAGLDHPTSPLFTVKGQN